VGGDSLGDIEPPLSEFPSNIIRLRRMRLVKHITLKFGAYLGQSPLELVPTGITLFVGPNNSGKSLVLREIEKFCATNSSEGNHVLSSVGFQFPDAETLRMEISASKTVPNQGETVADGHILVQRINTYPGLRPREVVPLLHVPNWILNNDHYSLTRYYISLLTIRLDGATRTTLLNPSSRSDLLEPPTNLLTALFVDQDSRIRLRKITESAFGKHFTIDALNSNQLRSRLSDRMPTDEAEEQALDSRARTFHKKALEIVECSDGVKAFTGMVAAVIGQKSRIPLIDEPEAFLHPPLARRLGKELTEAANRLQANAFIATHSAHFLMGCVTASPLVNIVRLTFKNGRASARLLTHERLQELTKSPLMRSTGVLQALFHEGAVVCEGDSDRPFYEEINSRLTALNPQQGLEAIFINAHSKQNTAKIAGPLRQMGIPAAIVIDFDILNETEDMKHLLRDLDIPSPTAQGWCQTKALLVQKLNEANVDHKQLGLSGILDQGLRDATRSLLVAMQEFGIFVVPNGQLESWQPAPNLSRTSNKKQWLINAFEALGDDPDLPNYIHPQNGDVWNFIRSIGHWINNPDRCGV
jgi:predicted ATPase